MTISPTCTLSIPSFHYICIEKERTIAAANFDRREPTVACHEPMSKVQTLKIMNPTEIRDFREENNHVSGI